MRTDLDTDRDGGIREASAADPPATQAFHREQDDDSTQMRECVRIN
jgi:hypothetical protein